MITHLYFDEIDSTNDELKRRYHRAVTDGTPLPEGWTVVSAGHQTAGKGRSGHQWESPTNDSIATSMIFYPGIAIDHVPRLTILAGMAVSAAIERTTGLSTSLKWPNDVLLHNRKVCGILSEMEPAGERAAYVVIGIGVNVHQKEFPPEIRDVATSVDLALMESAGEKNPGEKGSDDVVSQDTPGRAVRGSRKRITYAIWEEFQRLYQAFEQTEDLTMVLSEYNQKLVNVNHTVRVLDPLGEYEGVSLGIDPAGDLLVRKADGTVVPVNSGEVSVRGIYGYV